ncbi:hypothetical protein LQL77_07215 [Rhodococcus cerastii]|nr:hypothetical protein [Rhodococcus cerastii]
MIELDYAYLAEYAVVADGKLTAVGASFVQVEVPLPIHHRFAVAGRIRSSLDVGPYEVQFVLKSPQGKYETSTSGTVHPDDPESTVYGDKRSTLFVMNTVAALIDPGLYELYVTVAGNESRRLAFEVVETGGHGFVELHEQNSK